MNNIQNPLATWSEIDSQIIFMSENGMTKIYFEDGSYVRKHILKCALPLEFIGGLWRSQRMPNFEITKVRDKYFTLENPRASKKSGKITQFDATMLGYDAYGFYRGVPNYTVLSCLNNWSYGENFSQAYAKLSELIFDKNIDIITQTLTRSGM